jgi:hypothetical protein
LDVKLSNPPPDVIGQYAYIFLTPHVRVKFHPHGPLAPWLLVGGGYARFLEKRPAAVPSFIPGTNTGTAVSAAASIPAPFSTCRRSPSDFAWRSGIFIRGHQTTIGLSMAARTMSCLRVVC